MRHTEKVAPVAAVVSALATLACCLPAGFAAATVTGTIGAFVQPLRSWFLGASIVLVLVGVVQVARGRRTCDRSGTGGVVSIIFLSASAVTVVLVLFFPQVVAGLVADWMP